MKTPMLYGICILAATTTLSGCAHFKKLRPATPKEQLLSRDVSKVSIASLVKAKVCCENFSKVTYQPFQSGSYLIDQASPVMPFSDGQSYLAAFKLPEKPSKETYTLSSTTGKTAFPVEVMLLDEQFNFVRNLDTSRFLQTTEPSSKQLNLQAPLHLSSKEKYLVVYANRQYLGTSLPLDLPTDKVSELPYAAWGVINIQPEQMTEEQATSTDTSVLNDQPVISKQTKAYYRTAIRSEVAKKHLKQAKQLVKEAQLLGYVEAETIYQKALKKKK